LFCEHAFDKEINACKEALSEQEPAQEPVAVIGDVFTLLWAGNSSFAEHARKHQLNVGTKLYTYPAQPLSDDDILIKYDRFPKCDREMIEFARAIEQAHKIGKNNGI
jgi:hypothetical protein